MLYINTHTHIYIYLYIYIYIYTYIFVYIYIQGHLVICFYVLLIRLKKSPYFYRNRCFAGFYISSIIILKRIKQKLTRKIIFACLFSVHNTISLSRISRKEA